MPLSPARIAFSLLALLFAFSQVACFDASTSKTLSLGRTTTNGRQNPLGLSAEDISLAWSAESDARGVIQSAYAIRIGLTPSCTGVWDSGRVTSGRQIDIPLPKDLKLRPATRYYWQVKIWNGNGVESAWSAAAWFETALSSSEWTDAKWIAHAAAAQRADSPASASSALPLFRRSIRVTKPVQSARLYASAHGVYQFSLNGKKVGDQFLAPGWTDYAQRLQVQTYDVGPLLQQGENALGAALGDGWFRGKVGLGWNRIYGDTLALIAKLRITYTDGSTEDFVTDASWRSAEGPFVRADLQDGEHYDARREHPGWDRAGFADETWTPVSVVQGDTRTLVAQPDEPVRATELLTARSHAEPVPGEHIYDLGQNLVGVTRIKITGKAGQTLRLRHAEEIIRQGENRGRLYTESLRSAKATDTYTFARDETVVYQPSFTQHGFRYLEVTGVTSPPDIKDVSAVVLGSDLQNIGDLRLSHPLIDQLVRNIRWGQRGNFLSIPTDTPARDERLGWTGDIAVFASTASRYQDTRAFLSKWMDDLRDAQRANGNIPAIVPQPRSYFDETGVGWSDAFIVVPYAVWRATGDTQILRRNWEAMRRFYALVQASAMKNGKLLEEGRSSWFSGDWLSLEKTVRLAEHRLIATAYFAENTRMMAEMAAALGEQALASEWAVLVPRIRDAFVSAFRRPDGSLEIGTQTVYAMALGMDLITEPRERALTAEKFVEKLAADDFHLKTGFLGTPWLLPALSRMGRDDLAMRLLLNEDYPSWGFEIRMGATTMWERWNTIRADGQFGPVEMNSFNHYAYGAVGDWIYQHLGGIEILEPGYKKFRVAPLLTHPALDHAKCRIETPYGLVSVEWARSETDLKLTLQVPANTSAEVVLPVDTLDTVRESGIPVTSAPGVFAATAKNKQVHLILGSGRYEFTIPRPRGN